MERRWHRLHRGFDLIAVGRRTRPQCADTLVDGLLHVGGSCFRLFQYPWDVRPATLGPSLFPSPATSVTSAQFLWRNEIIAHFNICL